jgi:HEXXH motif-containing protein
MAAPARSFEPSPPSDLTLPEAGSLTARAIFSMALRKLFEDLKALRLPPEASDAAQRDYRTLREVLVGFLPGRPGAIASLLRQPTVSAPLRCLLHQLPETDGYVAELVGQSLYALALDELVPSGVSQQAPPSTLMSPRHDAVAQVRGPLAFDALRLRERGRFVPVTDALWLATADNNPERMRDAHPDKEGNPIDLGGKSTGDWVRSLRDALDLVGEHLPDLRREMDLALTLAVPVGFEPVKHLSASYRQAIGTVYLTLHPNPVVMAEALVHEHSHAKINALVELDPILSNHWDATFPSPYRPDPRPMMGVLLGAHAFVAVERFLERLADPAFEGHLADLRRKNREAVATLVSEGRPTPVGAGLIAELERLVG